jgi:hypothetical protein
MRHLSPTRALFVLWMAALLTALFVPATAQVVSDDQQKVQNEIQRAKIFREAYPIIAEVDLYCSPLICEGELPGLRILSGEKGYEKTMFSDADIIHLNQGKQDGLEIGQVLLVITVGDRIGDIGWLANRQGRALVEFLEDHRALARLEKSCGRVMAGDYLVPFEEKETFLGKDMGFEAHSEAPDGLLGTIIYVEREYIQLGSGGWAVIDKGEEDGIQVGQQLTICKQIRNPETLEFREDLPEIGIGNSIVVDVGKKTATIKVLSCSDPISKGHMVRGK